MRRVVFLFVIGWALGLFPRTAAAQTGAPFIVYLDFSEGTDTVTPAEIDDAPSGRSAVASIGAAPYPAFTWPTISTGAESRRQVVERVTRRVHELFLPYNVLITLTRPAAPPYTRVLIGGGPRDIGLDLSFGGVAYMDCGNKQDVNIVFAFPTNLRGNEHGLVVTIAQEAGHAFGLEHTTSVRDLMHPLLSPEQASFLDTESAIFDDKLCGNATQNSHLALLTAVGPWRGDEKPLDLGSGLDRTPPTVLLREPAPGAVVAQPLALHLEVADDTALDRVEIETTQAPGVRTVLRRPPFAFSLAGFPPGPLTFTVTVHDRSGNAASLVREVVLTATPELPTGCRALPGQPAAPMSLYVIGLALALVGQRLRRRQGDSTDTACTPRSLPL